MDIAGFLPQDFADLVVLGLSVERWMVLIGGIAAAFLSLWLLRRVLHAWMVGLEGEAPSTKRSIALLLLSRTRGYFLFAIALTLSAYLVGWGPKTKAFVLSLLGLALLLQSGRWGDGLLSAWARREQERRLQEHAIGAALVPLIGLLGRVLLWSIIVLVLLDNAGVDITALIAGLGVGGIALGLGLQNVVSDLFASLSIILDRPFDIGDYLVVGEHRGTVTLIGMRSTRIRSLGGEEIVFCNRVLLDREIHNFGRMQSRRVLFALNVTYDTPRALLVEIPAIVREVIDAQEIARFDRAHFKGYGDWALEFECVYFVDDSNYGRYMDVHEQINLEVHRQFEERRIEFAFPTRTVHVTMDAPAPAGRGPHSCEPKADDVPDQEEARGHAG